MAMASVCCSSPMGPILSSGSASDIVEEVPTAVGEVVAPVAEPVTRDTPAMHSVTIFDRQRRVAHKFSVAEVVHRPNLNFSSLSSLTDLTGVNFSSEGFVSWSALKGCICLL